MTADLNDLSAAALSRAIRSRQVTALAAAQAALSRIEALNGALNAYRVVLPERALAEAAAIDAALVQGRDPGPLAGVPYGVKDLFDVAGLPTAAGSKIGLERPPATDDAVLVHRLRQSGAVLLGVQVMDEYAYGFTTENAHSGAAHNPHDLQRSAGGSSGGSAAAVAAGLGVFSLGSDTNGSIRVPSSFCGLYGLKPTFGRLPRTGSFPFVFDLDHLGPFARDLEDLALIYDALQGYDPGDPACVKRPFEPVRPACALSASPLRIGVLGGWFEDMAGEEALTAVADLALALGARERVDLTLAETARSAAFLITAASGGNLHRLNLRRRPGDFDPATRGRMLAGGLLPADALLQAQRIRRAFYDQAMDAFARFDLLLAPATPCSAPLLGQATIMLGGEALPTRPNLGVMSQPVSAIGLPALTVPAAREGALPVGVQLIAPPWREDLAFRAAGRLLASGTIRSSPVVTC